MRFASASSRGQVLVAARPGELHGDRDRRSWMHRAGAGGDEHGDRVHVEGVAGVDDDVGRAAEPDIGQGLVHRAHGENRGHRQSLRAGGRVVEQHNGDATAWRDRRASAASRSIARASPSGPSAVGHVASTRAIARADSPL